MGDIGRREKGRTAGSNYGGLESEVGREATRRHGVFVTVRVGAASSCVTETTGRSSLVCTCSSTSISCRREMNRGPTVPSW